MNEYNKINMVQVQSDIKEKDKKEKKNKKKTSGKLEN